MRNSFVLFQSYKEYFEDLSGDEAKELLLAIFEYENTRVKPANLSTKVGCYFLVIKQQLDKNYEEYLKIVEINKANGAKGGRPKTQTNPKNPMGFSETDRNPKNHDNDNDYDNDVVNDNDIDIDIEKEKKKKKKSAKSTKATFQKPTKEELKDFALQEQLRTDIIDEFMDYYDSTGWRLKGGLSMKDWQATYRRWCRKQQDRPKNRSSGNPFKDKLRELEEEEKIVDVGEE